VNNIPYGRNTVTEKYSLLTINLNNRSMNKLEKIYEKTAAIDIGSEKVFVSAEGAEVRNFRTFTSSYRELGAYLKDLGIVKVAMESTGVYWVVLYDILEEMGFDLTLVNPSQVKNLPGRKTDVQDCQWIQKLFSYGLLSKSFVPTDYIRKLRVFTRLREDKLRMSSSHINHMQKALVQMNIRLPEVLSQIHGVSGMAMIEAILEGERNPKTLLNLCTSDLKKRKGEEILLALEGNYKEEYLFELRQAYEGFMFYKQQIASCDLEAEKLLNEMNSKIGTGFTDDKPEKAIRHNRL
jgi:transposase